MQRLVALLAVALVAAACGGGSADPTPASTSPSTSAAVDAPGATTAPGAGGFDGPAAPDFTLVAENRDTPITLSEEAKPVYMVFWAEW